MRTYVKPFANWIWLGALIMAAGGVVSLTDRRYRVGAPARAHGRADRRAPCPAGIAAMRRLTLSSALAALGAAPRPPSRSRPTRSCPTRRRRPARATSPASCAAWSASPNHRRIRTPTSPATCACWCASASSRATATHEVLRLRRRPLRRVRAVPAADVGRATRRSGWPGPVLLIVRRRLVAAASCVAARARRAAARPSV